MRQISFRLLLIDADRDRRELLTSLLTCRGGDVVSAGTVKEALKQLETMPLPSMIVLEILPLAPECTAFLERLKKDPGLSRIPVFDIEEVRTLVVR